MPRWSTPARGGFALPGSPAYRPVRHAELVVRSLLAALALALHTVAGVLAAGLALAPLALRRGPAGRRVTPLHRQREDAGVLAEPAPAPADEALPS